MKNMKKVVAVVLCVLMVMALASCGGKKSSSIKIGASGPLTGGASSYGTSVNNGAMIAIKEINAAGGLNGITLEYEMKDDEADPANAASAYDALYDAGMQISIGSVTSGACESFGKRAAQDNVFFMTPSASAATVIAVGTNAFRVCFGDPDQGILAAENLTAEYTKIGAIYDTSDTYSSGIYEAFEAKMKELGKTYEVRTFDQDTNKDFTAQVEALKDCEVIFLPIYYTEASLIIRACQAKGLDNIAIFGCDGLDGVAAMIDSSVKNKVSYITPFDVASTETKTANFVKNYQEAYNVAPDQFAADGYDAIYAVYEGMKAADVKDADIKASELCDKVVAAITASSFSYAGVTGKMTWDVSGACTKVPVIVVIDNN